jgi:Rad3-related DNA helicase
MWINLSSPFDPDKRPVHVLPVASLSRAHLDQGLPQVIQTVLRLAKSKKDLKGIIHTHSYAFADAVFAAMSQDPDLRGRVLYPKSADDRQRLYETHKLAKVPTIFISPSVHEGYDFRDDYARWQVILKTPYPSLGDPIVKIKMQDSQEWYNTKVVMNVIQASGRVCRSEQDWGETYIFDSDFVRFYRSNEQLFPNWWKKSLVWH